MNDRLRGVADLECGERLAVLRWVRVSAWRAVLVQHDGVVLATHGERTEDLLDVFGLRTLRGRGRNGIVRGAARPYGACQHHEHGDAEDAAPGTACDDHASQQCTPRHLPLDAISRRVEAATSRPLRSIVRTPSDCS